VGWRAAAAARGEARERLVGEWGRHLAAVPLALAPTAWQSLALPSLWAVRNEQSLARQARLAAQADERRAQADLLPDLAGNPFRPVRFDPAWLNWNDGTVGRVARAIAAEGAFEQLPVLADALEEAGCGDPALLGHLRGPGPHVRGCWALRLVLGGV
jgi:hypothetical protein